MPKSDIVCHSVCVFRTHYGIVKLGDMSRFWAIVVLVSVSKFLEFLRNIYMKSDLGCRCT